MFLLPTAYCLLPTVLAMLPEPAAGLADLIERFDHISLGVKSVESALPLINLLGGTFVNGADHIRNDFRWVQFRLADGSRLEMIAPLSPESFLQRFLDKRGEGLHHVTYKVTDVEIAAARASSLGYRTSGLHLHPTWSEVFLHPSEAHGVVIQLAAWPEDEIWSGYTLADVLAGQSIDQS
jgi:methylmalonyl-CoA/ethylmalonyl-CoA epimerase